MKRGLFNFECYPGGQQNKAHTRHGAALIDAELRHEALTMRERR